MYNDKIYKYSIRDTTELLVSEWEGSDDPINDDITTAQVTITADDAMVFVPIIDEGNFVQGVPAVVPGIIIGQTGTETRTVTVPLYKGVCGLVCQSLSSPEMLPLTASGNATILTYNYMNFAFITGDCTVSTLVDDDTPHTEPPQVEQ